MAAENRSTAWKNPNRFRVSPVRDRASVRPDRWTAGTAGPLTVRVVVGAPVGPGEGFAVGLPFGFSRPQADRPERAGYTTVRTEAAADLDVRPHDRRERFVRVTVRNGRLRRGDSFEVVFGDVAAGSPGARAPFRAAREAFVSCHRLAERPGMVPHPPRVSVEPGPCVRVRAYLTPTFTTGERVVLTLVAEDEYGNRDERFSGVVRVVNPRCGDGLPETIPFRSGDRGVRRVRFTPRADLPSVRVACDCAGAGLLSSPAVRTARSFPYRLFFGELHAHTDLSYDAAGSIDELYTFARETAVLDFAAASDHQAGIAGLSGPAGHGAADPLFDMAEMPARWEATRRAAARHRRPGRFETFVGSEWAPSGHPGHRNVYFLSDDPPQAKAPKGWKGETDLLNRFLRGRRALVVPHHPAIAWNARCDNPGPGMRYGDVPAAFQPVVEIASRHGSSECRGGRRPLRGEIPGFFVADMLADGRRFGFIGGSDTHQGDPGSTSELSGPFSTLQYRSGLAAVWARELTREALWEAIFARRTFAASGNRTVVSFEVGGLFMGEEGRVAGPRRIVLKAWSGAGIIKVEILKNGAVIHAVNDHLVVPEMTVEHEDGEKSRQPVDYYYARVVETEGHVVWTSPVWAAETEHQRTRAPAHL